MRGGTVPFNEHQPAYRPRACDVCGERFLPRISSQKRCSEYCRRKHIRAYSLKYYRSTDQKQKSKDRWRRKHPVARFPKRQKCIECGVEFLIHDREHSKQRICGTVCRRIRDRRSWRNSNYRLGKTVPEKESYTCDRCGVCYRPEHYNGKNRYCSKQCQRAQMAEYGARHYREKVKSKPPIPPAKCVVCRKTFMPKNRYPNPKYCSRKCRWSVHHDKNRKTPKRSSCDCAVCGVIFTPDHDIGKNKYCSRKCRKVAQLAACRRSVERRRIKLHPMACEFCGKIFLPRTRQKRKYCSIKCTGYGRYVLHKSRLPKITERQCVVCDRAFLPKRRDPQIKFCSDGCYRIDASARAASKHREKMREKVFDAMRRALRGSKIPPHRIGDRDMQSAVVVDFDASLTASLFEQYRKYTPEERMKTLQDFMIDRLNNTMKIAMVVCAMVKSGDNIEHLGFPRSVIDLLDDVRTGKLLPQAFDYFSGSTKLQQCISLLPVSRQKLLIAGETVPLVVIRDGKTECLRVSPRNLTVIQLRQVFDGESIRDEGQQVAWMADQDRKVRRKNPKNEPEVEVHKNKKMIVINKAGLTLTAKQLAEYLSQLQ